MPRLKSQVSPLMNSSEKNQIGATMSSVFQNLIQRREIKRVKLLALSSNSILSYRIARSNLEFRKSSLRVTDVMSLDAFREQAFAAALPPTREDRAAAFGPHSGTETVLPFARSFGWLIRAFHKTEKSRRDLGAVTVGTSVVLSTSWNGQNLTNNRRECILTREKQFAAFGASPGQIGVASQQI